MIRRRAQSRVLSSLSSRFGLLLLSSFALGAGPSTQTDLADQTPAFLRANAVTNVAQFKTLTASDYAIGCDFQLSGVVTLVDTNRNFLVLQDATEAVALNALIQSSLQAGEMVVMSGSNCSPAFMNFPAFPHRPALKEIRSSFEAPMNRGDYYLTRMRGWLRPPVNGHYTFWIASDNSSELWLSLESDTPNPKKIAFVSRYCWVAPREFNKLSSQKSEAIWLESGKSYYIEALQEQTHGDANLAVAWQGPDIPQSIITEAYLSPWSRNTCATNGILLEHWTNYTAGALDGVGGARPFESILSVDELRVIERQAAQLPKPRKFSPDSKWLAQNNYCWVETEGLVTFAGEAGDYVLLTLDAGKVQVQARSHRRSVLSRLQRSTVRIEGVCEAFFDENGALIPGAIWVPSEDNVSVKKIGTSAPALSPSFSSDPSVNLSPALEGFYGTRGVITFNGRVFGNDCLFVQEGNAVASVKVSKFKNELKVGDWVDLGGSLEAGRFFPTIKPMVVVPLGRRPMPAPVTGPIELPLATSRDGRWTELEGVARFINTNGTISLMTAKLPISIWVGGADANELDRYVDARLRIRGVLSAATLETPILLVPSRSFVEVDEAAPEGPFSLPLVEIASIKIINDDPASIHRIRVEGEVTMLDGKSFFIQDNSGGIRVLPIGPVTAKIGDRVEVIGFPVTDSATPNLSDALVRAVTRNVSTQPLKFDLRDALPIRQNGSLVTIAATLLATRTIKNGQVLDLQEAHRVFTATLTTNLGSLPTLGAGSRLEITGVCDTGSDGSAEISERENAALACVNLWLRSSSDVKVLSGPPWWSWQRASALVGTLLAVLMGALLWVHLLRRRLERQRAAQLAASEQILKRLEEERRRIAANLHDSLGQVLLAIKNQTLVVLQRSPCDSGIRERLSEISGATSQAIEEVRQITHGLRPYQLDRLGLTQAMRATVSRASANSPISFASRVENIDDSFDKDSEIHVYRIVQEAINNILKHSSATEAAVVIKKRSNNISLSIRDNGRGFDFPTLHASQSNDLGYGLSGITERMRILGGNLTIDSKPGAGASLNFEIPISNNGTGNHSSDRGRSSTAAAWRA
jgi:signal transduction histidine kinase